MSNKNKRLKMKSSPCSWKILAFLAFFIGGSFVSAAFSPAYAQYSGGDETAGSPGDTAPGRMASSVGKQDLARGALGRESELGAVGVGDGAGLSDVSQSEVLESRGTGSQQVLVDT